ncbi:hypothetical protein KRMM14A1259_01180 [Krasilnikovia sp. MM14-A1259]
MPQPDPGERRHEVEALLAVGEHQTGVITGLKVFHPRSVRHPVPPRSRPRYAALHHNLAAPIAPWCTTGPTAISGAGVETPKPGITVELPAAALRQTRR